jgi:hypothetical protein
MQSDSSTQGQFAAALDNSLITTALAGSLQPPAVTKVFAAIKKDAGKASDLVCPR